MSDKLTAIGSDSKLGKGYVDNTKPTATGKISESSAAGKATTIKKALGLE